MTESALRVFSALVLCGPRRLFKRQETATCDISSLLNVRYTNCGPSTTGAPVALPSTILAIAWVSKTPSYEGIPTARTTASATTSTCIGGIESRFAIDVGAEGIAGMVGDEPRLVDDNAFAIVCARRGKGSMSCTEADIPSRVDGSRVIGRSS